MYLSISESLLLFACFILCWANVLVMCKATRTLNDGREALRTVREALEELHRAAIDREEEHLHDTRTK